MPVKKGEPNFKLRKPTNAQPCTCGETVFAYTSLFCVAIVDAEDGHWLRDYKWNAAGRSLESPFYARSRRYYRETGSPALHQAVMGHAHEQYDHVNGNGHDCRKANLRPCTHLENQLNRKRNYTSQFRYKGVYRGCNRWIAHIRVGGERIYLGSSGFESDAAIAYNYAAAHYFGDFAKLNRIKAEDYMHD